MEHEAVKSLKSLDERWPGFFDLVKVQNGFEVEGFGYEDLMRINEMIIKDEQGIEIFARSMMRLMHESAITPEVARWLEDNGFVAKEVVDLRDTIERIESEIHTLNSDDHERRKELSRSLDDCRKKAERVLNHGTRNMSKGFSGLRTLLGEH